jgi:hypothetical protein
MKRMFAVLVLLAVSATHADELAPGYIEQFGYGSIVVSGSGYPPLNAFTRTQFEYDPVKKVFYIKLGRDMTINMRQILPKGFTLQKCLDSVVQEKGQNLKYRTSDVQFWSIWASHDAGGNRLDSGERPWPARLNDIPLWDPVVDCAWEQPARFLGDISSGFRWDAMGPDANRQQKLKALLRECKPGQRLYVLFRVGYAYEVPAGQVEEQWDPLLKRWIRRTSTGAVGYVLSDPISACTIELR